MCITEHYHLQAKLLKVCQKSKQNMMGSAKDVRKERTQRRHFQVARAKGILEIIHSDVYGPMSSSSLSGYVYYVSFIDEFSRKTWIYFMKNKDEVFSKFREFKALIENHTKNKIKTFRSDNGGEFTSNEFKSYAKTQGLRGSYPLHIIQNKMGLQKGRIELSWKLQEQ